MKVVVINKTKYRAPRLNWKKVVDAARRELKRRSLKPVQLVFVSAKEIQDLNRRYRGKNRATNVLSFPETRDILIAPAVVKKEAKEYGLTYKEWLIRLFIHGILHLEGYAHDSDKDAKKMEAAETEVMKRIQKS